jgi:hypothetical protein
VPGRGWSATDTGAVPLGAVLLAVALLSEPIGPWATPAGAPGRGGPPELAWAGTSPAPNLTVSPALSWADAGNATSLTADWSSGSPDCVVVPEWFRWSVLPDGVGGSFSAENASSVNFTGATGQSGTASVQLRSAAELRCGNATDGLLSTRVASVTEVAPLALQDLEFVLASPSVHRANLTGRVAGGVPPYDLTVIWGPGDQTRQALAAEGPFYLARTLPVGQYLPRAVVGDASGQTVAASAPQPLAVGVNATATIVASAPVTEVGHAVEFTGVVHGMPRNTDIELSACGGTATEDGDASPELTCVPRNPGSVEVVLSAIAGAIAPVLRTTLSEPVVPPLTASVSSPVRDGEVDVPVPYLLNLTGGAPPFAVRWSFDGGESSGTLSLSECGTVYLEPSPNGTGFAQLTVSIVDAVGVNLTVTNSSVLVGAALGLSARADSSLVPGAARVDLVADVTGGIGPVAWAVLSSPPVEPGESPTGWLPGPASLHWTGWFAAEGEGVATVAMVDAVGAIANATVSVPLLPGLSATMGAASLNASDGPGVVVTLNLSGGAPPFEVWINASGGAAWNASDPADGPFVVTVPLARGGPTSVEVAVVDALGARVVGTTFVIARDPPPGPPPSPDGEDGFVAAGGVVLLLSTAAAALLYLRGRRRARAPQLAPDPAKVLERIIAPADGAERVTVELLAEEEGIPLETVRTTLDRLIATGRVRSEVSPDGEEVLAWSDTPRA